MTIFPSPRSISRFVFDIADRVQTDGSSGLTWAGLRAYQRLCIDNFPQLFDYPWTNVFNRDWDVLILLDACRVDLLQDVEAQYDFLKNAKQDSVYSPSGLSHGWMEATMTDDFVATIRDSTYITGNPHSEFVEMTDRFAQLDEAWRNDWDDNLGTIPARPLTNRAIWYWRNTDTDRMIVHYMQPHFPSIPCIEIGSELDIDKIGSKWDDNVWDRLRKNELTYERVWDAYQQNLEYVLDDVQLLLQNIDAQQVVISADHGNATGECGFYGHGKIPLTCVREVPWYEVPSTDQKTHEPSKPNRNPKDSVSTESKLRSLGYLE